jgi:hypothetical protein
MYHTASDGALLFFGALTGDQLYFWLSVVVKWVVVIAVVLLEGRVRLARKQDGAATGNASVAATTAPPAHAAATPGAK